MFQLAAYSPVIIVILGLAVFVYLKNPKHVHNRLFAIVMATILAWAVSLFIADSSTNLDVGLNAVRSATLFATLIPLSYLYFSLAFPVKSEVNKWTLLLLAVPPIVLMSFSFSDLMIAEVKYENLGAQPTNVGPLYSVLGIYFLVYFLTSFVILYKKRNFSSYTAAQIKIILSGSAAALIINILSGFVFVMLGASQYTVILGAPAVILFAISMAYVIVRHRLFDIRLVVARSVAYALSILFIGSVYGLTVFGLIDSFFPETGTTRVQMSIYSLMAVLLAFTFHPLKLFFDKYTNRIFYRDKYSTEEVLNNLGKVFITKSNNFELLDDSLDIITNALKVEFGRLIVLGNTEIYKTEHIGKYENMEVNHKDLKKMEQQVTIVDEVSIEEAEILKKFNTHALVRLTTQDGLAGYLLLGDKLSGTIYTQQDVNLLELLSQELAVAIQNAKSYQEIQAFSETMEKEVLDATAKLRETNQRLQKLDQAKDEFISMASHQLRTPLTTIKGYLSMLLEGDAGEVPDKQKEFIDLAFVSSQRMAHLISDMLNVSRVNTGKLTIDREDINLVEIVESEIEQLKRQADMREVELNFHKPRHPLPLVCLDEGKMRQVIMNFTDNAIYYAPQGQVDVYVEQKGNTIEFRVTDNGIGVTEDAKKQLFSKFFRAENARFIRPDGTGLGLYMAKQVIEAQDGEIIFDSKEGEGSTFGFRFNLKNKKVNKQSDT